MLANITVKKREKFSIKPSVNTSGVSSGNELRSFIVSGSELFTLWTAGAKTLPFATLTCANAATVETTAVTTYAHPYGATATKQMYHTSRRGHANAFEKNSLEECRRKKSLATRIKYGQPRASAEGADILAQK